MRERLSLTHPLTNALQALGNSLPAEQDAANTDGAIASAAQYSITTSSRAAWNEEAAYELIVPKAHFRHQNPSPKKQLVPALTHSLFTTRIL